MEIVTENGKDYLQTYVAKIDNSTIDANALFFDVEEALQTIIKKTNHKNGTKYIFLKAGYGSNLQSLSNRFNGSYFSPSFLKGYLTNPALMLMQNFFTEQANDATAIGTTFHKILEEYYKLPGEERERKKLYELEKQYIPEGQDVATLDQYINGYYSIKDYLHPRKELDDKTLNCKTEHRGSCQIYVRRIDYNLPCNVSYVADRIDFRDDDVIILDYKTGTDLSVEKSCGWDGYLSSMILYKWAMEQELNVDITKGYLICPGNSKKYLPLDYSIENEKILADKIDSFYNTFMQDTRSREYKYTDEGYFTTDDSRQFREMMNDNTIWMSKVPLKLYIGEHDESVF